MTENQINKNSPEYKQGYSNGLFVGGFAGLVVAALVGTVANYSHSIKHENSATSNLEKALTSPEVVKAAKELRESKQELYETADKMVFESNPDKETIKVMAKCQEPYLQVLNDCIDQYEDEDSKCRKEFKRSPQEQVKFSACVDKYGRDRLKGIRVCERQFPYSVESDRAYSQCHDAVGKKIDACAKSSYDTYRECGNKALEQGFKRFKEQKNPEMRK